MAREFFIAPRIGTGTTPDPFRPKVSGNITGYVSACNETQCLVLVTGDTSANTSDTSLLALVAANFDTPISSLSGNVRNRIQSGLSSRNIPITLTNYATVRDFLTALGGYFDPNFDLDNFWVVGQ
jgi:hypothetical protein